MRSAFATLVLLSSQVLLLSACEGSFFSVGDRWHTPRIKEAYEARDACLILGVCHRSPTLIKLPSHALNSSTRDVSSTPDARVDRMRVLVRERVYIACMMTSVPTGSVDSLAKPWPPRFPTQLAHFFPPSKSQGTIALVRAIRVAHPSEGKKKAV